LRAFSTSPWRKADGARLISRGLSRHEIRSAEQQNNKRSFISQNFQQTAKPIAVIAPISDQGGGWRQVGKDQPRTCVIAHLPLAEHEDEGLAAAVTDSVQLRVQAAFRAPDPAGNSPFFKARRGPVSLQMGGIDHDAFWL